MDVSQNEIENRFVYRHDWWNAVVYLSALIMVPPVIVSMLPELRAAIFGYPLLSSGIIVSVGGALAVLIIMGGKTRYVWVDSSACLVKVTTKGLFARKVELIPVSSVEGLILEIYEGEVLGGIAYLELEDGRKLPFEQGFGPHVRDQCTRMCQILCRLKPDLEIQEVGH